MKRILFAGTSSSSGKTTISCGFMKVLVNRGQKVASFKCGPDYIDPMFHERIVGTHAGNLDGFFLKNEQLREMLLKNSSGCDIAVVEGVMGCYDGIGFTREASGYEVAVVTGTPIVLIVNARGMAASMVALVRGFLEEDRKGQIRGVILNQLSAKLFPAARREIEAIRPGLICYGYVPVNPALELKSRHLGLVTPDEVRNMEEKVALAAKQLEETVDVDGLIRLAEEAEIDFTDLYGEKKDHFTDSNGERGDNFTESSGEKNSADSNDAKTDNSADSNGKKKDNFADSNDAKTGNSADSNGKKKDNFTGSNDAKTGNFTDSNGKKKEDFTKTEIALLELKEKNGRNVTGGKTTNIRIAIAKDRAFSFLYRDNLNWLAEHGAEPVFFSPLEDEKIPSGCHGLILPGGYPELYLEGLEKNESMRMSVRQAIGNGMPTIAECGGFLYLLDQVEGHAMAGIIHQTAKNSRSLGRFGYIYLTAQTNGLLADAGEVLRAHEFHHYTTDDDGCGFRADKAAGTGSWETGYHTETLYAGFPHIYFPGNENAGGRFLDACEAAAAPKIQNSLSYATACCTLEEAELQHVVSEGTGMRFFGRPGVSGR